MNPPFKHLFLPFQMGAFTLKNRIVGLPIYTGYAHPGGHVSDMMIDHYTRLAHSGAAMIVVANAAVLENGILSKYNLRIDHDEFIPQLKKLATAIKSAGAVACLQLNHAGKFAKTSNPLIPSSLDASNVAFNINSLKDFMEFFPFEKRFGLTQNFLNMASNWNKGMTEGEKEYLKKAYVRAACRAIESGFQGIEIHGATGYLICQFLSGFTHKEINGNPKSFSDRIQFPLELVQDIKLHLPSEALCGYRIILEEWVPDGIDLGESLKWAKRLLKERISYLSTSAGTYNSMFSSHARLRMQKPAYMSASINKLKDSINIPVIAAGRIIQPEVAESLIESQVADLIGLGRPLRTDTNWIKKTYTSPGSIKTCVNCNWCLKRVVLDRGFNCRKWKLFEQEKTDLNHRLLSLNFGSIWVIADKEDIGIYKKVLATFLPHEDSVKGVFHPTALFLNMKGKNQLKDKQVNDFISWADCEMRSKSFPYSNASKIILDPDLTLDKAIASEIVKTDCGIVFVCRNTSEPWRNRLPYRIRQKVIGILGTSPYQNRVLVPVDMSSTTALMLSFIRQNYHQSPLLRFYFLYIQEDNDPNIEKRWKQLANVAGYNTIPPLECIQLSGSVAQTILNKMNAGQFGSVIMGKRSVSRIKRWLLGTTSAAVFEGLTDESVFIIE